MIWIYIYDLIIYVYPYMYTLDIHLYVYPYTNKKPSAKKATPLSELDTKKK